MECQLLRGKVMDLILETNGIIKKYGNKTVLNNINMKIKRGDIWFYW